MPVSLCLSVNEPLRQMRTEEETEKFKVGRIELSWPPAKILRMKEIWKENQQDIMMKIFRNKTNVEETILKRWTRL